MPPTSHVAIEEVTALCKRLRLKYVREQLEEVVLTARAQRWDPAEMLRVLFNAEAEGRDRATITVKRRRAHLPVGKSFDTWDSRRSSIPEKTQKALASLEWISRSENLAIAGPSGLGKSHMLEALANRAIDAGHSVAWFSIEDLGALVRRHRVDDTVAKAFSGLASLSLAVVDDIGLMPISADAAEGLYRLVDAAYERRSVAISSNLHPSKAHRFRPTYARWCRTLTGSS